MAVVAAPPSQGLQAELGNRLKFQRQADADAGRSWQSLSSSSNFSCAGLWNLRKTCRLKNSGVGVLAKNWCQDSVRINFCTGRRKDVLGTLLSGSVSSGNSKDGAVPAGFRRRITKKVGGSWMKYPPPFLIHASAAGADGPPRSEAAPEEDDIWSKSSLPPYFKQFARPPKEKLNWVLIVGGMLFVIAMRKAIMTEMARWVLGSVAAFGYISQGSVIALEWIVDRYGQHLGIVLTLAGWVVLALQDAYSFIIDMTPVGAVLSSSAWVSAVLSVADVASAAAREGSGVYLFAGLWGLLAVLRLVPVKVFLFGLVVLAVLQRVVRKTDMVAAVTPMVAVLTAVGDPVVKLIAFALFLALAVRSYSKSRDRRQDEGPTKGKQPLVLVLLMACVGISVAATALHARQIKWIIG